ncbi:DUF4124 domain-containing protein [Colwellia hornerae]|uniref:DUF4124 domain-containing protein n=1 Tax=Colwellia hornerae TaxID=89402 RepID=A0A5C6QFY9_9GAMM|nr:DUF4124 domain-containing protein [Colwellia hornerae]TWX55300.1 DUF4124 domain-containing protein [Colwellia hornerae]TWX61300.1 DUF4124 domain-containing protein [Colwellia hornerae]TWX67653.1 DUF4124 domain-containing protein [Colwellia hornerae]
MRYSLLLLTFIITLLSCNVFATSTKIYVWRSDDGILVFSDSPKPGAEEVEIREPNTASSVDTSMLDLTPKVIKDDYQVEINQPKPNATIRDNTGSVYIAGSIKPIFKQGLTIQLFLDGIPHQSPQSHSMFVLRNIDRGEHVIKMQLLNEKGKIIASSKPITFYMHRASVNNAN